MKQVIQNFKSGELYVDDVPAPALSKGQVLVENKFSLISAGTERGTVKVGKANLIGKAKQRPDLVAQVIQNIRKEGIKATLNKVQTKLDSLKALGYSTSGIVKASMDTNSFFKPGDRVACAGQDYASHADFVSIPQNLVAKIPDNVSFEEASFTTLGAIAMQGVRQANPTLGENVCVIGLGLLGQLTCQLLQANGCNVFGIDFSSDLVELAKNTSKIQASKRNEPNLKANLQNFTGGHGFDSIIITAATVSNDPLELATEIAKRKGRIIIVGAVKMDIQREPYFYKKELELKISTSYGPGRYDPSYEEEGHDYPYAYVRWTEQRNMEAFLQLIAKKKLDINPLISHVFDIEEAAKAYDIVLGKVQEPHIGILLKYHEYPEKDSSFVKVKVNPIKKINIGFIGAGSFAQSYLIPNSKSDFSTLEGVVTTKGITSKSVANKFNFSFSSSNPEDVFKSSSINTVFVATPHNTHAEYVMRALKNHKHVFVEKPLALNLEELEKVKATYEQSETRLMVGFNRRFAPVSVKLKEEFSGLREPLLINCRVNAGAIPKDHWIQNPEIGGGRIVGEICHFIDLMQFFTDAKPVSVFADCLNEKNVEVENKDNLSVIVKFENGSMGTLTYTANGDKSLPKERLEIYGGSKVGIINDFKSGSIYKNNKQQKISLAGKGHAQEVKAFLGAVKDGGDALIPFESIYLTTLTTFKIIDSLTTGLPQEI